MSPCNDQKWGKALLLGQKCQGQVVEDRDGWARQRPLKFTGPENEAIRVILESKNDTDQSTGQQYRHHICSGWLWDRGSIR